MRRSTITIAVRLWLMGICAALFAAACGDFEGGTGIYQRFDWDLHGTWTTNDPGSLYTGKLVITNDRITITGYGETQTPISGNDTQRPFRNFTRGIALPGYSEEGHIFIEDAGILQEGIPYTYWCDNPPPDFKRVDLLRFTFGGRQETLQKNTAP